MKMDRFCLDCGSKVTGRADRKFCSDACRINYHNSLRKKDEFLVNLINKQLKRNRTILEKHYRANRFYMPIHQLHLEGFREKYHTHTTTNGMDTVHFFYEYGITFENASMVHIWKEEFQEENNQQA
ncbi:MAG TPA: hypothetical protein PLC81_04250 [Bacteroidales bacterium]|nr:hypothetical protein [Bacteroidales bacterium]